MTAHPDTSADASALDLARQHVYRFLSLATSDPRSARWARLLDRPFQDAAAAAAGFLADEPLCRPPSLAPGELSPAELDLLSLVQTIRRHSAADLNVEYERLFGLMLPKKCPPYETEYCPQTFSVYRSQALADVAGFYRAFGLQPSRDMPERADHVSLELEFMAFVIAKESCGSDAGQRATCREAQRRFVREHLCWWLPAFSHALQRQSRHLSGSSGAHARDHSGFYADLARALAAFIPVERAVLDVVPPTELVVPGPVEPPAEMSCDGCVLSGQGGVDALT